ncbi:uncharacterized protein A4U43_C05F5650 [Asparagus officinalis]|uniref:Major facilitator superfamily (MFS) profile domain-containing protein n=1 Tax=Asparagus officinalis TaxID=4686 RepID=A0A5P1ETU0_ASPOF|nr:uncharacterized protein A4U43_C05F5650 [Asparagus officinalis]
MAGGGGFTNAPGAGGKQYPGGMTWYVAMTCIVAATGGLIFGYDIGISGGVTSMDSFLIKFFPDVYRKEKADQSTNQYCKFDSVALTLFTSSLYLAALLASLVASTVTRSFGRKPSMLFGGLTFLAGAAINGAAKDVAMLIVGRMLLGVGVGFANQMNVPSTIVGAGLPIRNGTCQISRLAQHRIPDDDNHWHPSCQPHQLRYFQDRGWLGMASLVLPDTPNSLIERGHEDKARAMLRKIRGTNQIDEEFNDLVVASEESRAVKHPWRNIMQRKYRPQLMMSVLIPFFQQFTGINVVMFYAPVLFKTVGFGDEASLMSAVITGTVNMFATLVSIFAVDRVGRRKLFLEGGLQMIIGQTIVGTLIAIKFGTTGEAVIPKTYAVFVVMFICVYVVAFAWSWGPLGWLVPSEIFPLEIRSAGQSINVSVNMFFTFIVAQAFLAMLCKMKFGLFYFFAGWCVIMTVFIYYFLPETKNVPIEEMVLVWKNHWFWCRFIEDSDVHVGSLETGKAKKNSDNNA